jgi:hypothetical protein
MGWKHLPRAIIAASAVCAASSHAATQMDPCSLLTSAQVDDVLGTQVGPGKHLASLVCEWTESRPGSQKKATVTLLTERGFAAAKTQIGGSITKTPASGIGDEAIFGVTGKVATTLAVKKGAVMFVVRVQGFPLDQPQAINDVQAKEKALALQIISKV